MWLGLNRYFVNGDEVLFGLLPPRMSLKDREMYRYWVDLRSRGWKARGVDGPMLNLAMAGYSDLYVYRFDWDEQSENWFLSFPEILGRPTPRKSLSSWARRCSGPWANTCIPIPNRPGR